MKRIKATQKFWEGALGYRTGKTAARKILGDDAVLDYMDEYGPQYVWTSSIGECATNWRGEVLYTISRL